MAARVQSMRAVVALLLLFVRSFALKLSWSSARLRCFCFDGFHASSFPRSAAAAAAVGVSVSVSVSVGWSLLISKFVECGIVARVFVVVCSFVRQRDQGVSVCEAKRGGSVLSMYQTVICGRRHLVLFVQVVLVDIFC